MAQSEPKINSLILYRSNTNKPEQIFTQRLIPMGLTLKLNRAIILRIKKKEMTEDKLLIKLIYPEPPPK